MTATISANPLGILIAFGAGIISFLSPCVLPSSRATSRWSRAFLSPSSRPIRPETGLWHLCCAASGCSSPGSPSSSFRSRGRVGARPPARIAQGAALGCRRSVHHRLRRGPPDHRPAGHGLGASRCANSGRVATVVTERRFQVEPPSRGLGAPVMGMAFAFAWTPCIGPVLGAVTALAATRSTLAGAWCCCWLFARPRVPFAVTGLAFGRLTTLYAGPARAVDRAYRGRRDPGHLRILLVTAS